MSLRSKIVLILGLVALLYVGTDVALLRTMVAKPFRVLEEDQAAADLARVRAGLDATVLDVAQRVRAVARRPVTAALLDGTSDGALDDGVVADLALNLLYVCDADGTVAWGRIEASGDRRAVTIREFPAGGILPQHPLLQARRGGPASSGLMTTERGPMLVASHEVRDAAGEPAGFVIGGRFFDDALRAELLLRTLVPVELWAAHEAMPGVSPDLQDEVTGSKRPVLNAVSDERLDVYTNIEDVLGYPRLVLRSTFDRAVTAGGNRVLEFALLSTMASALLLLLVLLRLLDRIVIKPLLRLTAHTADIGRTEDMSARVGLERDDELGQLSREFDGLMDKLARSREQVIRTSRLAGMSEIATGVLHNVGNVLNSVNVSANLAKRRVEELAVADLAAMTDVLAEHADDLGAFVQKDPRGRQFLPFLRELSREMAIQHGAIQSELRALGNGVDHIMELVRSQQSYAGMSGVYEASDLGAAVDAALKISEQAYTLKGDFEIVREYAPDVPKVPVDRNKLTEILVNLIQNARQIMEEASSPRRVITLRVRLDGEDHARIEVEDTGPGIAEADLARIFSHGFTTRKNGHGFGLHISANAATEMGSELWAQSEGPGRGATFILRLPLRARTAARAA